MSTERFLIKVEKATRASDYTWMAIVRDLEEHNLYFYGNSADEVLLKVLSHLVENRK